MFAVTVDWGYQLPRLLCFPFGIPISELAHNPVHIEGLDGVVGGAVEKCRSVLIELNDFVIARHIVGNIFSGWGRIERELAHRR